MRSNSRPPRATPSATTRHLAPRALWIALSLGACERSPTAPVAAAADARARSIAVQGLDGAPPDAVIVLRIDGATLRASALGAVIAASPALAALGPACGAITDHIDAVVLSINEAEQRSWVLRGAIASPSRDACAQRISAALALPYERVQGALWFGADDRRAALRSASQGSLVRSAEVREAMTLSSHATAALVIDGARARFAGAQPRWAQLGVDPVALRAQWSAVRSATFSLTLRSDRALIQAEITTQDERELDAMRALLEPVRPRLATALRALDTDSARALAPRIASNLHWIDTARSMRATLALDAAATVALARIAVGP